MAFWKRLMRDAAKNEIRRIVDAAAQKDYGKK